MGKSDPSKPKKKKKICCCCCPCCGSPSGDDSDVINNYDEVADNTDDAAHITAISKRNQTSSMNSVSSKKGKNKKRGDDLNGQETATLMSDGNRGRGGGGRRKDRNNCRKCCLRFMGYLFSHLGLCCLVVGYSIMGGFLFQWLESDSEEQVRFNIRIKRDEHIQHLWAVTKELNVLHEGNWSRVAQEVMTTFQKQIYDAVKGDGWDGKDESVPELQWSFPGSLLYSVTVITTIGYGHISPKTDLGRLITIFYAIVGIPLTLLFLTQIGKLFGNCFRFSYKYLCKFLLWLCCPNIGRTSSSPSSNSKNNSRKTNVKQYQSKITPPVRRQEFLDIEKGNGSNAQIEATATTPGSTSMNDETDIKIVPQSGHYDGIIVTSDRKGQCIESRTLKDKQAPPRPAPKPRPTVIAGHQPDTSTTDKPVIIIEKHPEVILNSKEEFGRGWAMDPAEEGEIDTRRDRVKEKKKSLKDEVRVPMFVSVLFLVAYIVGGAVMFSVWEEDWDLLVGSYFCFITLSTIGFGDYVFGMGDDWDTDGKLIMCALYLVLGLSIIAMTFDLMQEEVKIKFKWLGTKLGFTKESS